MSKSLEGGYFQGHLHTLCVFTAQTVQTKFDAVTMYENPKAAAQANMPDDGTGQKKARPCHCRLANNLWQKHAVFGFLVLVVFVKGGGVVTSTTKQRDKVTPSTVDLSVV